MNYNGTGWELDKRMHFNEICCELQQDAARISQ